MTIFRRKYCLDSPESQWSLCSSSLSAIHWKFSQAHWKSSDILQRWVKLFTLNNLFSLPSSSPGCCQCPIFSSQLTAASTSSFTISVGCLNHISHSSYFSCSQLVAARSRDWFPSPVSDHSSGGPGAETRGEAPLAPAPWPAPSPLR